jgi:hypothetical protein
VAGEGHGSEGAAEGELTEVVKDGVIEAAGGEIGFFVMGEGLGMDGQSGRGGEGEQKGGEEEFACAGHGGSSAGRRGDKGERIPEVWGCGENACDEKVPGYAAARSFFRNRSVDTT